jgi:SlyX protein
MESRITELEVKQAFQDELLDALNLTVSRQQKQIDLLQQQLQLLYQQMRSLGPDSDMPGSASEVPPHY